MPRFYVEKDEAIEFLEEKLDIIGLNKKEKNEFISYTKEDYSRIRNNYSRAKQDFVKLQEARDNKLKLDWKNEKIKEPNFLE